MRALALASALGLLLTWTASASDWKTDFTAAQTQAARENKIVLLDFTGSDWCTYCVRMKKDTLDQTAFLDYAKKNLVLVEVDFPRRKRLSAEQTRANEALQRRYKVGVFPTFVVVDSQGRELGRKEGYVAGGPEAFIKVLEQFKKKAG